MYNNKLIIKFQYQEICSCVNALYKAIARARHIFSQCPPPLPKFTPHRRFIQKGEGWYIYICVYIKCESHPRGEGGVHRVSDAFLGLYQYISAGGV